MLWLWAYLEVTAAAAARRRRRRTELTAAAERMAAEFRAVPEQRCACTVCRRERAAA